MITDLIESSEITKRAMKAARLSWSTEHLSTEEKDITLMIKLLKHGPDHAAALRQAPIWMHITATRSFWQEYAKYGAGCEMYSESTMHTLKKKPLSKSNFYREDIDDYTLDMLNKLILEKADLVTIKNRLPEGFLQRRAVMVSYPAAMSMFNQRNKHKWPEWKEFLTELLDKVEYPQLIDVNGIWLTQ